MAETVRGRNLGQKRRVRTARKIVSAVRRAREGKENTVVGRVRRRRGQLVQQLVDSRSREISVMVWRERTSVYAPS
jgi:hypothetical protein